MSRTGRLADSPEAQPSPRCWRTPPPATRGQGRSADEVGGEVVLSAGPVRARQSYRHEAFLWNGRADFVDGLLPFIEEGLDAGEAVLVAATPEHGEWLVHPLVSKASRVQLTDIARLARNPARIIPACPEFLQD